ncbi:MAG: hypothetical protein EHM21_11395, partial [Chloroflexi bacterium]
MEGSMRNQRKFALGSVLLVLFLMAQNVHANTHAQQGSPDVAAVENSFILVSTGINGQGGGSYAAIASGGRYVAFESPANDLLPGVISGSWDEYLRDLQTGQIERTSTRSGGAPVYNPGAYTSPPALSENGRYVVFMSEAVDLVTGDTNRMPDIFLHDRSTNTTELVSITLTGKSGNDASFTPAVSADGRFVVFQSFAGDLVQGDTNNSMDIFIRDRQLGVTELVSVAEDGAQGSDWHDYGFPGVTLSADGRYVAFAYERLPVTGGPDSGSNVYLRDRQAQTTRWIAAGTLPTLTGDGRFLAFVTAEALAPDDNNTSPDVYLMNLAANQFERISVPSGVNEPGEAFINDQPAISGDGRFVAFETNAALVPSDNNTIS